MPKLTFFNFIKKYRQHLVYLFSVIIFIFFFLYFAFDPESTIEIKGIEKDFFDSYSDWDINGNHLESTIEKEDIKKDLIIYDSYSDSDIYDNDSDSDINDNDPESTKKKKCIKKDRIRQENIRKRHIRRKHYRYRRNR